MIHRRWFNQLSYRCPLITKVWTVLRAQQDKLGSSATTKLIIVFYKIYVDCIVQYTFKT